MFHDRLHSMKIAVRLQSKYLLFFLRRKNHNLRLGLGYEHQKHKVIRLWDHPHGLTSLQIRFRSWNIRRLLVLIPLFIEDYGLLYWVLKLDVFNNHLCRATPCQLWIAVMLVFLLRAVVPTQWSHRRCSRSSKCVHLNIATMSFALPLEFTCRTLAPTSGELPIWKLNNSWWFNFLHTSVIVCR